MAIRAYRVDGGNPRFAMRIVTGNAGEAVAFSVTRARCESDGRETDGPRVVQFWFGGTERLVGSTVARGAQSDGTVAPDVRASRSGSMFLPSAVTALAMYSGVAASCMTAETALSISLRLFDAEVL
jgi:hypothetical protein